MAYRRSKDQDVSGSRWRIAHRTELHECGIPSEIYGDDRRWSYVLFHGDDLETGWDASWPSEQQAEKLLALLERHLDDTVGVELVDVLRRRFL
jgi:hypothetical protein